MTVELVCNSTIINSAHLVVSEYCSDNERKLFMDEINVMKRVSDGINPHVLKMIACVTTTHPMMLLMEFVPHGSLKDYLRRMKEVTEVRNAETS